MLQPAIAAGPVGTAPINWHSETGIAGELLKVRVGYEVARELAKAGSTWELRADSTPILASLCGIPGAESTSAVISVPFKKVVNSSVADISVVTDQGLMLGRINTLRFGFTAMHLRCVVRFETSADGKAYQRVGREQVIYQQLSHGKITSLLDASIDFTPQKYLRITFVGAGAVELKEILATIVAQPSGLREIPVTLGAMLETGKPAKYVWPVKFSAAQDLVMRLDLQADAQGTARELTIASLDAKLQPLRTVARFVWADRIQAGGIERSEYSITLPGLDPSEQYAVVANASDQAFPLTAVKAYTSDVWLLFNAPAKDAKLVLWLNPVLKYSVSHPQYDIAKARQAGEVGSLACVAAPAVAMKPVPAKPQQFQTTRAYIEKWWRAYGYGLGAILLALIAIALLRKQPSTLDD